MKTFSVEYLLIGASIWNVVMVKAGNKEQAQSNVKRMFPNVATARATEL